MRGPLLGWPGRALVNLRIHFWVYGTKEHALGEKARAGVAMVGVDFDATGAVPVLCDRCSRKLELQRRQAPKDEFLKPPAELVAAHDGSDILPMQLESASRRTRCALTDRSFRPPPLLRPVAGAMPPTWLRSMPLVERQNVAEEMRLLTRNALGPVLTILSRLAAALPPAAK